MRHFRWDWSPLFCFGNNGSTIEGDTAWYFHALWNVLGFVHLTRWGTLTHFSITVGPWVWYLHPDRA